MYLCPMVTAESNTAAGLLYGTVRLGTTIPLNTLALNRYIVPNPPLLCSPVRPFHALVGKSSDSGRSKFLCSRHIPRHLTCNAHQFLGLASPPPATTHY